MYSKLSSVTYGEPSFYWSADFLVIIDTILRRVSIVTNVAGAIYCDGIEGVSSFDSFHFLYLDDRELRGVDRLKFLFSHFS